MQPCKIGINELMISKEDYLKISDGMDNPVAISTTLAIGRFRPLNSNETGTGAACSTRELLNRTNENCAAMGTLTNSGHEQNGEFVYEYITNETAQNLFVTFVDKPASASWKYNIAFFDVDFYGRQDNISCPIFPLSDFYRKGPRT
ncbi:uncharacterized protein LOC144173329 [Haemaphysalis longicornis]